MLGLFAAASRGLKQWVWNNVALLVLTGFVYDVAITASDDVDTLQRRYNDLSKRVLFELAGFEQKLKSLATRPPADQAVALNEPDTDEEEQY